MPLLRKPTKAPVAKLDAGSRRLKNFVHWVSFGLRDIQTACLSVTLPFIDFADFWLPVVSGSTPTTALVASLPKNARDAVKSHLHRNLLGCRPNGNFSLTARAFAIRGCVS
jgi:hypothetical protein